MEDLKQKIKEIILENNYFDTLAGQRFKEWNGINNITAVISFAGRSKKHESYVMFTYDVVYVTHLMLDKYGNILVQESKEDTDDFSEILRPNAEPITNFKDEVLKEWVELLTF